MIGAEPRVGVVQRVADTVLSARTWEGAPARDLYERLIERFPGEQLNQVPAALGEAMLTLRLSPEHLQLALDTMFEFDLYEATTGLRRLLRVDPVPQALVTAATFARHPGTTVDLQHLVLESADLVKDLHVRQLVGLSLSAAATAGSRPYEIARVHRWPGNYRMEQATAPIVAVAASAGSYGDRLRFLLDLHHAGAVVRRLPDHAPREPVDPRWLARWIPVVAARDPADEWWRSLPHGKVFQTRGRLTPAVRRDTLHALGRAMPEHLRLRSADDTNVTRTPMTSPLVDTDAFFSGAFRSHEVAFLGGLTVNQLFNRIRDVTELQPVRRVSTLYWNFPVLVGLRVWTYLNARLDRPMPIGTAVEFVKRARSEHAVPVAVTRTGHALFHLDADLYEGPGGQLTSEHFLLGGDVLERFSIGNRHAPRLEEPTEHTMVHPEVQGGSPVVQGTRIPAEVVEELVKACQRAGLDPQKKYEYIRQRYPELHDPRVIDDAGNLVRLMQSTR